MKTLVLVCWTVFCLGGAGLLIRLMKEPISYTGSNITFTIGNTWQLTINAESVYVEAASSNFFLLRKLSGETIVGMPTQKPLGWGQDEYYRAGPIQVKGGTWIVEKGIITIHFSSSDNITVQRTLKPDKEAKIITLCVVGVVVIWIIVFAAIKHKKYKKVETQNSFTPT